MLIGTRAVRENFEPVGEFIVRGARGFGFNTFKIELAKRCVVRALEQAVQNV